MPKGTRLLPPVLSNKTFWALPLPSIVQAVPQRIAYDVPRTRLSMQRYCSLPVQYSHMLFVMWYNID